MIWSSSMRCAGIRTRSTRARPTRGSTDARAGLDDAAVALAGSSRPRLVAVAGPAGAGRGRVVEELGQQLQALDAGPVARVCAADRVGAALGDPDATWLAACIAGVPPTADRTRPAGPAAVAR